MLMPSKTNERVSKKHFFSKDSDKATMSVCGLD